MTSRERLSMSSRRSSTEPVGGSHSDHTFRLNTATTNATLVDNVSDSYHTALEDHVNHTTEDDRELKSPRKEPQISVFLTVFLLVAVTGVSVSPKSMA